MAAAAPVGKAPKAHTAPFVAWDTEGLGRGPRHRCVMVVTDAGPRRIDADGISTRAALSALWRGLVRRSDALHVSFAFGYDVMMVLKDLPHTTAATLWADEACRWGSYRISYTPRHSFALYRKVDGAWKGGCIWDTFGFFQASFLRALDSYGVGVEVRDTLAAMKARRSTFQRRDMAAMARYSTDECVALVALMERVRAASRAAGLTLPRWDGAGAVASALLRAHGAQKILPRGPTPRAGDPWPATVRDGARHAYFGGRIEVGRVGHTDGPVHRYDVRSAYPAILADLPDGGGGWVRVNGPPILADTIALSYVRWNFLPGARWYPFPWRARDGAVLFPHRGEGWYWLPELESAAAAFNRGELLGKMGVRESWEYAPFDPTARPWAWVRDLYNRRAALKAAGAGEEKILKLGLNSLYGKLAQSLGGSADQAPRWHCLEWAGYITSAIRARLFTAAVAAGPHAVSCATDALFTTRRVPTLDAGIGPDLGQWEHTCYRSGTWVQSGVYWTGIGADEAAYHRGFSPAVLHRADVERSWRRGRTALAIPETRFTALGASVGSASAFARRGQWITAPRSLITVPYSGQKRLVPLTVRPRQLAAGLVWTTPRAPLALEGYDPTRPALSAPVALPWTPDGIPPLDASAATEFDPED